MSQPFGIADILAGAMMTALTAYALLAGADFGGGVWDLLARGDRQARQRELIAHAIGPVWEANHVWLILVIVLLFTCFPPVFGRLAIALHVPLTLILIGIVLRGSAFTFRSYGGDDEPAQRRWGRVFASASLVTPLLLGVGLGTVAAGRIRPPTGQSFVADYIAPWLSPFTVSVGVLALILFAFLAAVYLTVEATEPDLQEDFRVRALAAGLVTFVSAMTTLVLAHDEAPLVWNGLVATPKALAVHLLTGCAAVLALWALWRRRYRLARGAAIVQVTLILWGWGLAQYPYLLPPSTTIHESAAPLFTLQLVLGALVVGAVLLFPSLAYLLRVFKGSRGQPH
ncbi:MAG TPA: cytochrome d ubiquinol oxidase subunit II [Gemmatimonadales bacterium]|nr:cytochrome d ubiquinol oxidase subunit II [Gemmatimonadales bacterium]